VPLLPLTLLLLGGFMAARALRGGIGAAWLARGVLAALFVSALGDLARDIEILT
jgi:hypothetical protein